MRINPGGRQATAAAALAVVVALAVAACGPADDAPGSAADRPSSSSTSSTTVAPSPTTATPSVTAEPTAEPTTTPTTTPTATGSPTSRPTSTPSTTKTDPPITEATTLRPGMSGPVVLAAQRRLSALGYWLGNPDGEYGGLTSQAVMALQKSAGLGRDGILGPNTKKALKNGVRPTPRTTSGSAVEIDKARQIVMVVVGGRLKTVLNTSTGNGQPYTSDGQTYVANTPEGRFSVQRQIDGMRVSRLGELWRPKYFTGGYALHGSASVPGYPASHGCARLTNGAIDYLWSSGLAPIGRTVWVYS